MYGPGTRARFRSSRTIGRNGRTGRTTRADIGSPGAPPHGRWPRSWRRSRHAQVCAHVDTSQLFGYVSGYSVDQVGEARSALQPLMLRYGFDAIERDGVLTFRMRDGLAECADRHGSSGPRRRKRTRAWRKRAPVPPRSRAGCACGLLRPTATLTSSQKKRSCRTMQRMRCPTSEIPLAMTRAEGRAVTERWLSEARVSIDTVRLRAAAVTAVAGGGGCHRP